MVFELDTLVKRKGTNARISETKETGLRSPAVEEGVRVPRGAAVMGWLEMPPAGNNTLPPSFEHTSRYLHTVLMDRNFFQPWRSNNELNGLDTKEHADEGVHLVRLTCPSSSSYNDGSQEMLTIVPIMSLLYARSCARLMTELFPDNGSLVIW